MRGGSSVWAVSLWWQGAHEVVDDVEVVVDDIATRMDVLTIDQRALIITSLNWLVVVQPTSTGCLLRASDQVPLRHHIILRSGVAAASSSGTFSTDDHLLRRLLLLL